MTLNHVNLAVPNVSQTQAFLETYFGFRAVMKGNTALVVLSDDKGLMVALSNFDKAAQVTYPEHFHIGFIQASMEAVDAIYQQLNEAGFVVDPPRRFHGSWTFYIQAPGGFLIEVLH